MASICLNKEACQSNGITLGEALLLIAIHNGADLTQAQDSLVQKGFITAERNDLFQQVGWRLTRSGSQAIDNVIADATQTTGGDDRLLALAATLKELYPKGKKVGTNSPWTEGVVLIARRLKLFFKKYGKDYTDEQIIEATRNYVQSFNGDYQFMRVLKYFIFKEVKGAGGDIEGTSDLYNEIEHLGEEETEQGSDWRDSVR